MLFERRTSSDPLGPLQLCLHRSLWCYDELFEHNAERTQREPAHPRFIYIITLAAARTTTLCCKVDDATPRALSFPAHFFAVLRDSYRCLHCLAVWTSVPSLHLPSHLPFTPHLFFGVRAYRAVHVITLLVHSLLGDQRGSPSSYLTCPCGTLVAWKITRGATSSYCTTWCFPLPTLLPLLISPFVIVHLYNLAKLSTL